MVDVCSDLGLGFIEAHEGFVSKAYRDSGGVITIGIGFTMLSRVFASYWMEKHGHALRMGDTMTREEANEVLRRLIAEEYAPPVIKRFGRNLQQHQFDGSTSPVFNCGAGTLKDRWANSLAAGKIAEAAAFLRTTRVTAAGKPIAGLKRRRGEEARLIEFADYGNAKAAVPPSVSQTSEEVKVYQQQLQKLGMYAGPIDGLEPSSKVAVVNFQSKSDLKIDGVVGPATRAALNRAVEALQHKQVGTVATGGGGIGIGGAESAPDASWLDMPTLLTIGKWALIIGAVALVASFVWRNRGVILKQRTPA